MKTRDTLVVVVVLLLFVALAGAIASCGGSQDVAGPVPLATNEGPRERIGLNSRTDSEIYNGADIIFYSNDHISQTLGLYGDSGNVDAEGDVDIAGDLEVEGVITGTSVVSTSLSYAATGNVTAGDDLIATDDLFVGDDGIITGTLTVVEGAALNGGLTMDTSAFTVADATGNTVVSGTLTVSDTSSLQAGVTVGVAGTGYDVQFFSDTSGDHFLWDTSEEALTIIGTNAQDALNVDDGNVDIADDIDVDGTSNLDAVDIDGVTNLITDTEHIGLWTVDAASVLSDTDGALWTIGADEIWIIQGVYCEVTTNFDCTGDDCTLQIGDASDPNGLLDLVDGELQASDTEMTGAPAGWQWGGHADTIGAYLTTGNGFVYNPAAEETIDIDIEDTSDSSDPTAGAATCYLIYMRVQ